MVWLAALLLLAGLVFADAEAGAAARSSEPAVFVCYSVTQPEPIALPAAQAASLGVRLTASTNDAANPLATGYWQAFAVDPTGFLDFHGDTRLGGYFLTCGNGVPIFALRDTGRVIGGSGEWYDATTGAAYRAAGSEGFGVYELFALETGAFSCGGCPPPITRVGLRRPSRLVAVSGCSLRGALPDASCTPGAFTAGDNSTVICAQGYTNRVPPIGIATTRRIYAAYGLRAGDPRYRIEHLVSPQLGGTNADTNLWPIRYARPGYREQSPRARGPAPRLRRCDEAPVRTDKPRSELADALQANVPAGSAVGRFPHGWRHTDALRADQ